MYICCISTTIVETLLARWGIKEDVDHMHSLKKYAPLERSNQCNICFITSLFLTPIIIIMNTVNTQYIYFWCGNILKEKNVLASCEEKCDWGIQAEPRLPLNGLLMIITIILSILWSSTFFSRHSISLWFCPYFCPFALLPFCPYFTQCFALKLCPCSCNLRCFWSNIYGKVRGQRIVWNKGKRAKGQK